jgi:hypothetical protein
VAGAHIGGQLGFDGARLTNVNGPALTADGLAVAQGMFCRDGFVAEGGFAWLAPVSAGTSTSGGRG